MTPNLFLIGYLILIAGVTYLACMKLPKISAIWPVLIISFLGTGVYQAAVYLNLGHKDKFLVIAIAVQLSMSVLASGVGAGLERVIRKRRRNLM